MEFRNLGNSGLKVTEIAYGNWLTHGSQVEEDAALACVRQALDEGITTFDTADVYANTAAETVLGKALAGERREGLEIFTKVYWPTGPGEHNDHGLSRKHIMESINGSLRRLQHRLRRPLPGAPLRPRDAARGDDGGFRRRRAARARRTTSASPSGARRRSGAGHALARELHDPVRLEPAAVQHAVAGYRGRGRARPARSSASARWSGRRSRRACSPASTSRASSRRRARVPPTRRAAPTWSRAGSTTTCSTGCSS